MAIPKIIHQTARELASLAPEEKQNIENLKALNPGWEHRFYSNADMLDYISTHYDPPVHQLCERIAQPYGVVLADLFRYLVIHREGGVYLDIKSTVKRPLDEVLKPDDRFLLGQWDNRMGKPHVNMGAFAELERISGGEFQTWHIVATPNHPFLRKVIQDVLFNMEHYNTKWFGVGWKGVLRLSGPICYSLAIAPMLARYRHRFIDPAEAGFEYSIYQPFGKHWSRPDHYSRQTAPIIKPAN